MMQLSTRSTLSWSPLAAEIGNRELLDDQGSVHLKHNMSTRLSGHRFTERSRLFC